MAEASLARARRSGGRGRPEVSPVGGRRFAAVLFLAAGLVGWLSGPFIVLASLGATWLPTQPALPVSGVLSGITVAIDPGHGGYDDGVLLNEDQADEVREADINLTIALTLRDILERAGARVVLTRTEDVDLVQPGDAERYGSEIRADLSRRLETALAAKPDVFLSLHCNAFPGEQWRGSQVFYHRAGGLPSRLLAEIVQGELTRVTGETDRLANGKGDLFLLREAKVPAAIVELGFLSNPRDLQLLKNPDYQRLCAMAVFFGLCRYFRLAPAGTTVPRLLRAGGTSIAALPRH